MKKEKPENHHKLFRDRSWVECFTLFLKEKVFSIPAQVMYATFLMFIIGYFTQAVTDEKFRLICDTLKWIFAAYAGGGVAALAARKMNGK